MKTSGTQNLEHAREQTGGWLRPCVWHEPDLRRAGANDRADAANGSKLSPSWSRWHCSPAMNRAAPQRPGTASGASGAQPASAWSIRDPSRPSNPGIIVLVDLAGEIHFRRLILCKAPTWCHLCPHCRGGAEIKRCRPAGAGALGIGVVMPGRLAWAGIFIDRTHHPQRLERGGCGAVGAWADKRSAGHPENDATVAAIGELHGWRAS